MIRRMMSAATAPVAKSIHDKLTKAFAPSVLNVINESSGHNVPKVSVLLYNPLFFALPPKFFFLSVSLSHSHAYLLIYFSIYILTKQC